jgi:hypothetical protein
VEEDIFKNNNLPDNPQPIDYYYKSRKIVSIVFPTEDGKDNQPINRTKLRKQKHKYNYEKQ